MLLPRQRPKLARGAEDKEDAAAVHGRMKMAGRIEVGAVMGRDINLLHGPALTIGQIVRVQSVDELQHARIRFPSA